MPHRYTACPEAARRYTAEEELLLILRAQVGDVPAMDDLCQAHAPCITRLSQHYNCGSLASEDLAQEGYIGFRTHGVPNYHGGRGVRLWTYAHRVVWTSLRDACAKWQRTPAPVVEHGSRVRAAWQELTQVFQQEPSDLEVARYCDLPLGVVQQILHGMGPPRSLSGSNSTGGDEEPTMLEPPATDPPLTERLIAADMYDNIINWLGEKDGAKWLVLFILRETGDSWNGILARLRQPNPEDVLMWASACADLLLPSAVPRDWADVCRRLSVPPPALTETAIRAWYSQKRNELSERLQRT